jgi:hypothetical protein
MSRRRDERIQIARGRPEGQLRGRARSEKETGVEHTGGVSKYSARPPEEFVRFTKARRTPGFVAWLRLAAAATLLVLSSFPRKRESIGFRHHETRSPPKPALSLTKDKLRPGPKVVASTQPQINLDPGPRSRSPEACPERSEGMTRLFTIAFARCASLSDALQRSLQYRRHSRASGNPAPFTQRTTLDPRRSLS